MPVLSMPNSPWIIREMDVSWPQKPDATSGGLKRCRQLSAVLERDIDSYDVARYATLFVSAPTSIDNLTAQIGDGTNPATVHTITFFGTWQIDHLDTTLDGGRARQRMAIWQYSSTWEEVPEA